MQKARWDGCRRALILIAAPEEEGNEHDDSQQDAQDRKDQVQQRPGSGLLLYPVTSGKTARRAGLQTNGNLYYHMASIGNKIDKASRKNN